MSEQWSPPPQQGQQPQYGQQPQPGPWGQPQSGQGPATGWNPQAQQGSGAPGAPPTPGQPAPTVQVSILRPAPSPGPFSTALPPRPATRRERREDKRRARSAQDAAPPAAAAASAPVAPEPKRARAGKPAVPGPVAAASPREAGPSGNFPVPAPGSRFSGGRSVHVALRSTALLFSMFIALASCTAVGIALGARGAGKNTTGITTADAGRYHITQFPEAQAVAFADRYVQLCMNQDPRTAQTRQAALSALATAGTGASCGWNGAGVETVLDSIWSGYIEPISAYPGHGAYIGIQVDLVSGASEVAVVPVYVADPGTGAGMLVCGQLGLMPTAATGAPPTLHSSGRTDASLASQLQNQLLPGYFAAWGSSSAGTITRYVAPDASAAATTGLHGDLVDPQIQTVTVQVPDDVKGSGPYTYALGQSVEADVLVQWSVPGTGATQTEAYRLFLVDTAQGWFIDDVLGGQIDPGGGAPVPQPSASSEPTPGASTGATR